MKTAHLLAPLAAAGALALPAAASATTFCVDGPSGCPSGATQTTSFATAIARAGVGSDGVADTVLVGPGTFAAGAGDEAAVATGTFYPAGGDPLLIQGAGRGATTLTSALLTNIYAMRTNSAADPAITLRALKVAAPAGQGSALLLSGTTAAKGDVLEDVLVETPNTSKSALSTGGVVTVRGSSLVAPQGTGLRTGSGVQGNDVVVEDTLIDGKETVQVDDAAGAPGARVRVRRSTLTSPFGGAGVSHGELEVESSLLKTHSPGGMVASAIYVRGTGGDPAIATVTGSTIVNTGATPSSVAIDLTADAGQSGSSAGIVFSTVVKGFQTPFARFSGGGQDDGASWLTVRHSAYTGPIATGGKGQTELLANVVADPQLDAGFRLPAGSPLVDAGDPSPSPAAPDRDGKARVTDGDGDGVARRDIGAFERDGVAPPPAPGLQPTPPVVATAGTPAAPVVAGTAKRCKVPAKLAGKTLKAARASLTKAGCTKVAVKRAFSKKRAKGRVVSASHKAGAQPTGKVTLVVSKGRRR